MYGHSIDSNKITKIPFKKHPLKIRDKCSMIKNYSPSLKLIHTDRPGVHSVTTNFFLVARVLKIGQNWPIQINPIKVMTNNPWFLLSLRAELSNNLILLLSSNMQVRFGHQTLTKHNSHTLLKGNFKVSHTHYLCSWHWTSDLFFFIPGHRSWLNITIRNNLT